MQSSIHPPTPYPFTLLVTTAAIYLCICELKVGRNGVLTKVVCSIFQSLVCLNGDIIRKDTINAMVPGNAKFLMDSVFELAQRLNHFRLSDAEIGLFCAVVIITPGK